MERTEKIKRLFALEKEVKELKEEIFGAVAPVTPELFSMLCHVADSFGMTVTQLQGSSRKPKLVAARVVFANLSRSIGASWSQIGRILCKNHSTVHYYHSHIPFKDRCEQYPEFETEINRALAIFSSDLTTD